MSTFAKRVTSAVAGLAVVFSIVSPIAGVSAAFSGAQAADKIAALGIIVDHSGNPSEYRLGDNISREELSKTISNLADLSADSSDSIYLDTDFASWSEKYAKALNEAGIAASNTFFNPKDNSSKIEALKWVMEARDIASGEGDNWMEARVNGAVAAGIATSFSDYNTDVTRGQVFIWAAEAIDADVVVEPTDPLCELLGVCDEDEDDEVDCDVTPSHESCEDVVTPPTTGGTASISLSPESPSNGLAAAGASRVPMLTFDVTAGSSDVTLEQVTLFHVGLGDRDNVNNLTVYNSSNESVSKTKSFSDNDLDISFDRDIVVQAGETQTFTIAASLEDNLVVAERGITNTTYQIELTALEASASVSGVGIVGAALTPTVVANAAVLAVTDDTTNDTLTIGEEVRLAGFSIEEIKDNEDVLIRTITLHQEGSIDADYIEDLTLEADGEVIASGMMVNSSDELVMNVDYILAADDKVKFVLKGFITGDVNQTVDFEFEGSDDVYATGESTGFNLAFEDALKTPNGADADELSGSNKTVEGAEIDVVFDRSDIDETRTDRDDVLVGTLEMTANSNDYEVKKVTVTVEGVVDAIDDLELGGSSFDGAVNVVTVGSKVEYIFEDIVLNQGDTEVLELEVDIKKETTPTATFNGNNLKFTVEITEVRDDENRITYESTTTPDLNDILSTTALKSKTIDIQGASFQLTQTRVNDRELVLANGEETVLFKAKVFVGDAEDTSIEDFILIPNTAGNTVADLSDIIAEATLNVGGVTYDADISSNKVEFISVNHMITAGSDNVEVLVTGVLKDDTITGAPVLALTLDSANLSIEDSEGETVANPSVTLNSVISGKNTYTTLREEGVFKVKVVDDADTDDNLENTVLAGNSSVVIAELELEAEYENMDVNTLEFTVPGDFSDTLNNVRIVDGSTVIADGAIVTSAASGTGFTTTIKFEDFTVSDTGDVIDAELVADLAIFTGEGDETSASLGEIMVNIIVATLDVDGANSSNDIFADASSTGGSSTADKQATATSGTVTGETVTIVPVLITAAVTEAFGDEEEEAVVTFSIDFGNNDIDNDDITVKTIEFKTASGAAAFTGSANVYIENENTEMVVSASGSILTISTNGEINNGDEFTFTLDSQVDANRIKIVENGIKFTVGDVTGTEYPADSNDSDLDLGRYTTDADNN